MPPAGARARRHSVACMAAGIASSRHQQLEGQRLQRVARQQGLGLAKLHVHVGLPRRSTSLSMQGMSSCTSE